MSTDSRMLFSTKMGRSSEVAGLLMTEVVGKLMGVCGDSGCDNGVADAVGNKLVTSLYVKLLNMEASDDES
jgi:hypothetical protein